MKPNNIITEAVPAANRAHTQSLPSPRTEQRKSSTRSNPSKQGITAKRVALPVAPAARLTSKSDVPKERTTKAEANRKNALKSTGPKTPRGKSYSRTNALKHGLYSKELLVSEADRVEFEEMRDSLSQQFAAATAIQQIAVDKVVCCCWRCKMALRIESRIVALQQSSDKEPKMEAAGGGDSNRMEAWYGTDYRSLQDGLRFLRHLRAVVADSGLLHVAQDGPLKESVIKSFGSGFYNRLMEWKGMSNDAILSAEHLVAMGEAFKSDSLDLDLQQRDPMHPETPKVVPDPRLQWQMVVKLVEVEIEHLETLVRTRGQDFREMPLVLAELSPRYYADGSRDLQQAVDWFLKLKHEGL